MGRYINAPFDADVQPFAAIRVTCDFQSLPMCFADDGLRFLEREGWGVDHCAVRLEVKFLRAVNLDPVHPVVRLFADGGTNRIRSICHLRAQVRDPCVVQQREGDVRFVRGNDPRPGDLHARALDQSVLNRVAEIDGAVPAAVGHQIDDGGEPGGEIALRVHKRDEFAVLETLGRWWR